MPSYAVIKDNIVQNIVIADSLEDANTQTGSTCVAYTETQEVSLGDTFDGTKFVSVKPYPSWTLNAKGHWQAPVARPEIDPTNVVDYEWDESKKKWNAK